MDIHQLRVFASVFKNRSFSKASRDLHLTQPTVSNHIKALEEEFDCRLFDRLGRTIIPTRQAEILYTKANEIIEKADALQETLGELKKEMAGTLVVGASTIPGVYLLPRIMTDFQRKHPSVSFQILIADSVGVVEGIGKHELLLGMVGTKLNDDQMNYVPFIEDELIVVAAPFFMPDRVTASLQELSLFPMVFREEGSGTRREAEKFLGQEGISLKDIRVAGVFSSTDAVKQAVKAGLGISILSRFSVEDELRHNVLREIKIPNMNMKRCFYIVTHKKRTLPRLYEVFLEHLLTVRQARESEEHLLRPGAGGSE